MAIAVGFGLISSNYPLYRRAGRDITSFRRSAVLNEGGMRWQLRWDRRWLSLRAAAPQAAFAVVVLTSVLLRRARTPGPSPPPGSIFLVAILAHQVGENTLAEPGQTDLTYLADTHDRIQRSRENLLPLGGIVQPASMLLLPTVILVLSVAGEAYLGLLLERLLR